MLYAHITLSQNRGSVQKYISLSSSLPHIDKINAVWCYICKSFSQVFSYFSMIL